MRLRVIIRGAVQGVGFRPFAYRLARELGLGGWVANSSQGVLTEVEGLPEALDAFLVRLQSDRPPLSFIHSLEPVWLEPIGFEGFEIRESAASGPASTVVLPDIAACPECLREILDPANRRYQYPFTNCTHCGPRFSIIESLPYDRANTAMKGFEMCPECRAEYSDPVNRRFHAQPNACPNCGPRLQLWGHRHDREAVGGGGLDAHDCLGRGHEALQAAARFIADGSIVAVKGLGGFHLVCLASDDVAVRTLRERKRREEKPFAVMFPSVKGVREQCEVSPLEERLLQSPESPIVLLRGRSGTGTAPTEMSGLVAPGNPWLGVMLPYTPLHHLLLREIGIPVVATSGNLSDEPICIDEHEAVERLGGIADYFLVHNRPIVRHVDDSIVRVVGGREMMVRRARGYAPLPITLKPEVRGPKSGVTLAVGAHLKNSVALAMGPQVVVSQHIGDLESEAAFTAFQRVAEDLPRLYGVTPDRIVADAHPDYLSTKFAKERGLPLVQVQHHLAHVLSCMAENELEAPVLGVAWDGTGFGADGTVWGGEFLRITRRRGGLEWSREAHLRPFRLPGGDAAVREPRRSALGLLHEVCGGAVEGLEKIRIPHAFRPAELSAFWRMLDGGLNSPSTSSVGRLFDGIAALTGLRQVARHEGQAAMELEFAAQDESTEERYPLPVSGHSLVRAGHGSPEDGGAAGPPLAHRVDWGPLIEAVLADVQRGIAIGLISARFHNALVEAIVSVARIAGIGQVVLSGGCFQNCRLLEGAIRRLREEGFHPYWHQRVPPNDGGIALGQVVAVTWDVNRAPSGFSPDSARD